MEKQKQRLTLCKKSISLLLVLLLVLTAIPLGGLSAFAATSEDFAYEVLSEEGKTCEITVYTGSATNLMIPSVINGYTVTSIGDDAFNNCTSLTSVIIPNSVTSIGDGAFAHCTSLANVSLPDSSCYIGVGAFLETAITQLDIPADTFFDYLCDYDSQPIKMRVPFGSLAWYCAIFHQEIELTCTTPDGKIISVTSGTVVTEFTLESYTLPSEIAAEVGEFYGTTIVQFTADRPYLLLNCFIGNNNGCALFLFDPSSGSVREVGMELTDLTVGNTYYLAIIGMTKEPVPGQFALYSLFDIVTETDEIKENLPLMLQASGEQDLYAALVFTPTENAVYYLDAEQADYVACDSDGRPIEAQEFGYALTAGETYSFIVYIYPGQTAECTLRRLQTENGFTYIISEHQVNITFYEGTEPTVTVPEQLGGYPVTWLYSTAFPQNSAMQSIVIPESVTQIGYSAYEDDNIFAACPNLKTIYGYTGSFAEIFANRYGYTFIPLTVDEPENGITVEFSPENPPAVPTALQVTEIDTTDVQKTYDITLTANGNPVQPAAPVTVKIPVPATMDGTNCKVYRQEADGTYTDMHAVYQGGYMVFTTDHFSIYVLTTKDPNAPAITIGDVNSDGEINAVDARWILQSVSGARTLSEEQRAAADVNGDGEINAVDARWVLQVVSGARVL